MWHTLCDVESLLGLGSGSMFFSPLGAQLRKDQHLRGAVAHGPHEGRVGDVSGLRKKGKSEF